MIYKLKYSAVFICLFLPFNTYAQNKKPLVTRVLFMFDASFSMSDNWQKNPKIDIAKSILSEMVDSLRNVENLQMGLRTLGADYSLYPERNCHDTRLVVPFGEHTAGEIEAQLKKINPRGTTPLAYALVECAADFTPCSNCRNIIILITDGIEECNGDPCEAARELSKKGVILKPFIIGIGSRNLSDSYACVGKYFNVSQEDNFRNILKVVISQALNNTTAQVNLLDEAAMPTETDVAMTFYDQSSGRRIYNFVHTINDAGNPDTISLDPNRTYHLVVHTVPEAEKKDITVTPGKHTIIAVSTPQGYLHLTMEGEDDYKALYAIVRKHDEMNTLNVQSVDATEKYLTGKYDLEIFTLPRMYLNGVSVSQNSTTTITIPQSGTVTLYKPSAGPCSIYADNAGNMEWVCNLDNSTTQNSIAMQPGFYHAIYRPQSVKQTIYTVDKQFEIKPGTSVTVQLE